MSAEALQDTGSVEVAAAEPGSAEILLRGAWTLAAICPSAGEVWEDVRRQPGPVERVRFDASGLTAWDSAFTTFVHRFLKLAAENRVDTDLDGLPEGVRRLLALARAGADAPAERVAPRVGALARLGTATLRAAEGARHTLEFLGRTVSGAGTLARGKARFRPVDLLEFLQDCGAGALPIVSLVSVLVGMILAFVGAAQLRMFGAEIFVANLVAVGMAVEMGALMTGIIMAGRTGAAFAARLGTMQVNEEIDALITLGFDPFEFLVMPRMLALIVMMPLLCLYANLLGILGGAAIGIGMLGIEPVQYYSQTREAATLMNFAQGLIKAAAFGVVIAVAGCLQGLRCGRSAQAVGEATTRAVVACIVSIVVVDAVFNVIFTLVL